MTSGRPITEADLHAYVDQALDAPRRAEVQAYLDQHPEIARRVAAEARQRGDLRAAFAAIAEEPVPATLSLAQLIDRRSRIVGGGDPDGAAGGAGGNAPRGIDGHYRPRRPAWQLAIAAVVLVGLGGLGGWAARGATRPGNGIAALAQEATDSYRVYAPDRVHPVELRAVDQGALIAWVSDRLAHPVSVPDLTKAGFRFMGGRVVVTAHGPAGLLMYDDDRGTRMVMLVRPMAVERDTAMSAHANGSVRGFSWARRGVGYSVVAEASADRLHPLADEVRRQTDAGVPG